MRMWFSALLLITSGCAEPAARDQVVSTHDQRLLAERATWYERQVVQDCPTPRNDDGPALMAVQEAHAGNSKQIVFGEPDPYNRRANVINYLRTRPNPRGEGAIVTAWEDRNRGGSADYSRHRSVWLVLDRRVYPLNVNAAGALGRLFTGPPAAILKRAGLVHTYERGSTMMDQLGIESETFERRFSGENPFPMCP
jgi:hypothetical protein